MQLTMHSGCCLLCRKGQPLPSLKIPVAAPATDHQYIQVQLLDHGRQLLASCQHKGSCSCAGGSVARHTIKQLSQQHHNSKQLAARAQKEQHQDNSLQMQPYQQQQEQWQNCLVYQQLELGRDGLRGAPVGLQHKQAALQELWVSPPAPGAYFVHVSHSLALTAVYPPCREPHQHAFCCLPASSSAI